MAYLDFKEISKVPFDKVLNHLGIVTEDGEKGSKGMLKGTQFIVTESKNLFLCPYEKDWKGSIINFWSIHHDCDLKTAAQQIVKEFMTAPKAPKRAIPNLKLEYCAFLRTNQVKPETSDLLEAGLCSQKSIMAGKVCFKMYTADGAECVGYIGYDPKTGNPIVPNQYKHDYLFNLHRVTTDWAIVAKSPLAACQLHTAGYTNVLGLTRESLTDEQVTLLSTFKRLVFYDCSPAAVMRMAQYCYVIIADDEFLGRL